MSKHEVKMIKGLNKTNLRLNLSYVLDDLDEEIYKLFGQKVYYSYSGNIKNNIYQSNLLNIINKKHPVISVFISRYNVNIMHFRINHNQPDEEEHVLIEWNDIKKLILKDMKNGHGNKENLIYNLMIILHNRFLELDKEFNLLELENKETQIKRYGRAIKDINLLNEEYYELLKSNLL